MEKNYFHRYIQQWNFDVRISQDEIGVATPTDSLVVPLARELIDACHLMSGELETQAERVGNNSYLAKQLTDLRHEMESVVSLLRYT